MRKFILYFLLVFLFAAVATFSYGFLNGEKIRSFASQVSAVQAKHDLAGQIEKIETSFRDNGKKEISQVRDESKQSSIELDAIIKEAETAGKEVSRLDSPSVAGDTKKLAEDYYSKLALQAVDFKGIVSYMSQIIDVAAVLGEIGGETSLDEIKNIIVRAKEKIDVVSTEELPADLEVSAKNLKESMRAYLVKIEDMASFKTQNYSEVDASSSYNDFSQKEDEFFSGAKKYIDGMEDLSIIGNKINSDLERLNKIKFSLK